MDNPKERNFLCPYCAGLNALAIDFSEGKRQEFVLDCEICCRPIVVRLEMAGGNIIDFRVQKENE